MSVMQSQQGPNNADRLWNASKSFLAGGFAGALAKTMIAPLDRIKILFQVSHMPFSLRAVLHELQRTVAQEGLKALFKGNGAQVLRVYPYSGIQLMAFDQYSKLLHNTFGAAPLPPPRIRTHVAADGSVSATTTAATAHPSKPRLTGVQKLLAGSMAGATSVVCTYPLDVMRARLAVSVETTEGAAVYHKLGIVRAFTSMHAEHGIASFYRGVLPTVLGILPYAGISFAVYEQLKQVWMDGFSTGEAEPSALVRLMAGGVAGFAGQASAYPLDIVRRRMQTEGFTPFHAHTTEHPTVTAATAAAAAANAGIGVGGVGSSSSSGSASGKAGAPVNARVFGRPGGMIDTTLRIVRTDGVRGLFKGLSMNLVKGPVGVGVSFTVYDLLKRYFNVQT